MAYTRRSRSTYRGRAGGGARYSRSAPRTRRSTAAPRRRTASRRSTVSRGQTVRLVIEQAPSSAVARPTSYLSAMNPALREVGLPRKAKL